MSTFISYFDETGDDGFPQRSSDLFVLTSVSMNTIDWKENYNLIDDFRKQLRTDYGIPKKVELHTKNLIMNKKPYRFFGLEENQIKDILTLYAKIISNLKIQIVNVVINKSVIKMRNYPVLHNALTYNIQRIENTLNNLGQDNKFIMITDEGRIGKMVKTVRSIQRFNPIPSKFSDNKYVSNIQCLVEDPIQKQSNESFAIQIADFVSYMVYILIKYKFNPDTISTRLTPVLSEEFVLSILDTIRPVLNLQATKANKYGIVIYPK